MNIYRVERKKHAHKQDGTGSLINGGRWNNPGTACIYASENRALPVLEIYANVLNEDLPEDLVIITFNIPDDEKIFSPADMPENWRDPVVHAATKNLGTAILKKAEYLLIKIPSVIIPQEFNYIINPVHPGMKKVTIANISGFSFDVRLKI
jgi:RES domain-containing protein